MDLTKGALSQLEKINHPKIKALKMSAYTWGDFSMDPYSWNKEMKKNMEYIIDFAKNNNLVLQFHIGVDQQDPENISKLLDVYGLNCKYHFVHMGEYCSGVFKFVPLFLEWIKKGYKVYCDVALTPDFGPEWLLRELSNVEGGVDRVLFATDAPWGRFISHYWKIMELDINESIKRKVFWDNAINFYGIQI
jgi:predicted TIM-barrel fold metal-dependent hydrolase